MVLPLSLSEKETEWSRRQKGAIESLWAACALQRGKGWPLQSPSALTSCR